jgi:hypothetical protein
MRRILIACHCHPQRVWLRPPRVFLTGPSGRPILTPASTLSFFVSPLETSHGPTRS